MMMNEPCFVLDRHAEPDFNVLAHRSESNSLQEDMQFVKPRHIILTLDRSVFALTPKCCVLIKEGNRMKNTIVTEFVLHLDVFPSFPIFGLNRTLG